MDIPKLKKLYEQRKLDRLDKELYKIRNFDELFNEDWFILYLHESLLDISHYDIETQKEMIAIEPALLEYASQTIKNDKAYLASLQELDCFICPYQFIGDRLKNDREFLLSIKDIYPEAFFNSAHLFTEEEIKKTLLNNPYYLKYYSNDLKKYIYYLELIYNQELEWHKMASLESGIMECKNNVLEKEEIKSIVIKHRGEKIYYQMLLNSLTYNPERIKTIDNEILRKYINLCPDSILNVEIPKTITFGNYKKNLKLVKTFKSISCIKPKTLNTPEKFAKKMLEISDVLKDNLVYEDILEKVNSYWDTIYIWINETKEFYKDWFGQDVDPHEKSDILTYMLNLYTGIKYNKLPEMFNVFSDAMTRSSNMIEGIKDVDLSDEFFHFYCLICQFEMFLTGKENIAKLSNIFNRINQALNDEPYSLIPFVSWIDNNKIGKELKENLSQVSDETLFKLYFYFCMHLNKKFEIMHLADLENLDDLINESSKITDKDSLEDIKNKILMKHFHINLDYSKKIVHSYFSSSLSTDLYRIHPNIHYFKTILDKINSANTMTELNDIQKELIDNNLFVTFKEVFEMTKKVKKEYGQAIAKSLINNSLEPNKVYDYSNEDFHILLHVLGAYGSNPVGDIYESWNTKNHTEKVSICCSLISSQNLGIAKCRENSVILGFNNLPDNYLELMSSTDLYSMGFKAERESNFMSPDELANQTRHGHNELDIRRRYGKYTENKLQPSYIVCFDNINEESKKAAKAFNVPIIFIDRQVVAQKNHNQILRILEEFKTTLNPNLISSVIWGQENNRAGLRLNRPDLVDKYFSTDFRQSNIDALFNIIYSAIQKDPSKSFLAEAFINAITQEQAKYIIEDETKDREMKFDLTVEKYIASLKKYIKKSMSQTEDISLDEALKSFGECRDKYSLEESKRINLIKETKSGLNQTVESIDMKKGKI